MSTIRANTITDTAGTGSPNFPNGVSFSGTPTAPTASVGTNTTQIATTAFVNAEISGDVGVANSSLVMTALNASGSAPIYACRAWVNFDGSSGAVRASGNVTSVSRTATGTYTINLTTAMADANYSAIATCDSVSSTPNLTTLATSSFGINTRYASSNTSQDKTIVTAAVFR